MIFQFLKEVMKFCVGKFLSDTHRKGRRAVSFKNRKILIYCFISTMNCFFLHSFRGAVLNKAVGKMHKPYGRKFEPFFS